MTGPSDRATGALGMIKEEDGRRGRVRGLYRRRKRRRARARALPDRAAAKPGGPTPRRRL
jgi:hypothetical protein